jgi:hypothetical protein
MPNPEPQKGWKSKLKSENLAGIISLAGSSALALSGDPASIAATVAFTAAEITMAVKGHTKTGYSAASALFAAGDFMLAASPAVMANKGLQMSLMAMGTAWGAGAMRAPLHKIADWMKDNRPKMAEHLKNIAEHIPTGVGAVNLSLRVPGAIAAATGQQWIVMGAITAWGCADVLAGRLQNTVADLAKKAMNSDLGQKIAHNPFVQNIAERLNARRGKKPGPNLLPTSEHDDPLQDPKVIKLLNPANDREPNQKSPKRGNGPKP